jgi:hypothetical protein
MSQQPDPNAAPTPAGVGPQEPRRRSPLLTCVLTCGILALIGLLGVILLAAWGWDSFLRFGINSDLNEYEAALEQTDLEPETRQALLDRIADLRLKLEQTTLPLMTWVPHDERVRGLLMDHELPPPEVEKLKDEFEAIRRAFEKEAGEAAASGPSPQFAAAGLTPAG